MTPELLPPGLVTTARLRLARPTPDDLDDVFALCSDPAVWEHLPTGRHTTRARTRDLLDSVRTSWEAVGLGSWVARDTGGRLVGTGGCDLRLGIAWNLGYRLVRDAWGHGYAQEITAAATAAARGLRPDLPVTAYLLEHNARSRAAAERSGLGLVWSGPDAGNPDPTAVRLLFADRPLEAGTVAVLTAT